MEPQFSQNEAAESCRSLGLNPVKLGGYLVVLNSDYDVVLCGEPYIALMLLIHLDSGKFIARVWNETVTVGAALTIKQLIEACKSLFSCGKPCLGVIENEYDKNDDSCISSYTPVQRRVSKRCKRFLAKDVHEDVVSCSKCHELMEQKPTKDFSLASLNLHQTTEISDTLVKDESEGTSNLLEDAWEPEDHCSGVELPI